MISVKSQKPHTASSSNNNNKSPEKKVVHAKKTAFQWQRIPRDNASCESSKEIVEKLVIPSGASSPGPISPLSSQGSSSSSPGIGGNAPVFSRQTSLPVGHSFREEKLRSILKRSRYTSEIASDSVDSDYARSVSPDDTDFWFAFRSVDDIFMENADDAVSTLKKRVSFSEKIMKNTYRTGACILQQKQKAQKKREKRQNKELRRVLSEGDAEDVAQVETNLEKLNLSSFVDSDSGLEENPALELEECDRATNDLTGQTKTSSTTPNKSHKKRKKRF